MWIIQNTRSESSRGGRILAVHDKWLSPSLRGEYRGLWVGCDRIGIFMDRASERVGPVWCQNLSWWCSQVRIDGRTHKAQQNSQKRIIDISPPRKGAFGEREPHLLPMADYDAWVLSFLATKEEALPQRDEHVRASFSYIGKVIIILFYDSTLFSMGKIAMPNERLSNLE